MKKIIIVLFLVLLLAGCAEGPRAVDETVSNVGNDISDIADLGQALDVSDLDALDKDLAAALDGLEG